MRLKDWFKSGLQFGTIVVAASFVYGLLMGTNGVGELLTMAAMYMLLVGALINVLYNLGVYKTILPVALSFGSTRKEAFVGMQCYRLVYAGLVMIAAIPLYLLAGEEGAHDMKLMVPLGIGLMLVTNAFGAVLGMIGNRFGKGATAVVTIIGALVSVAIMVGTLVLLAFFEEQIGVVGFWMFPAVGLVVYTLVSIVEYKYVFKYSVKL